MTSDTDNGGVDSCKSDEGGEFEIWAEQAVDIETPFSNKTEDDVDYLKLEVAELKQILISLAEKYKLSEDRRKVAERRNSFLKADNYRLQQSSDSALSQKIEAEIENRRTLDKLREFIDFKQEFEKQAELLKKIISHLPRMKNACTSTRIESYEKALQCSGDYQTKKTEAVFVEEYHVPFDDDFDSSVIDCSGDNVKSITDNLSGRPTTNDDLSEVDDGRHYSMSEGTVDSRPATRSKVDDLIDKETKEMKLARRLLDNVGNNSTPNTSRNFNQDKVLTSTTDKQNEDLYTKNWDSKPKKAVSMSLQNIKPDKGKMNLSKLKQEVLALKNLNEWKTSDLDYKNRQLAVKNRELMSAKKEITQLKMRVNSLLVEQQKRPSTSCINPSSIIKEISKNPPKDLPKVRMTIEEVPIKRKSSNRETAKSEEKFKLPLSNDSVWREIAPGDQVRIKAKRHE